MRPFALGLCAALGSCGVPFPVTRSEVPQDRERVPQPVAATRYADPTTGTPSGERGRNALSFGLGAAYWNELGSLSTAGTGWTSNQFGEFDRWGIYFDLGYDREVGRIGDLPWRLGLEWGFATFRNDGDGLSPFSNQLDSTFMRITPVARVEVPLTDGVRLVPGIGIGAYYFSIDEYDQDYYGYLYQSRTLHDEWAFGGFASVGLDFDVLADGGSLLIENEFHWVDFDQVGSLLPAESSVGGLVYGLQLGFAFRF